MLGSVPHAMRLPSLLRSSRRLVLSAFTALAVSACSGPGNFVWVHELPPPPPAGAQGDDYLINLGDVINVRVFEQEAMSSRVKVRSDGKVALPFLGDTEVRGKRPSDLARELEGRLKEFIVSPRVTVNVDEFQAVSVPVLGEVAHPGTVLVEPSGGVLQALANAGGLTEFADRDRIFVLRRGPTPRRIRFSFEALSRYERRAATFALQGGDVVVVE